MKTNQLLVAALLALLFVVTDVTAQTNQTDQAETKAQRDVRMAWWREAKFGMFIHWGVYSAPAGIWNGTNVTNGGAEWIMNRGRISVADYQKLPAQFNPVKFNADEWVSIAKNAGMKYIVITSKHHDGFAMFHSKADLFNIYDATPFKRDPLAELAAACKRKGIKLGFYYSQAQDWNHPGGAAASSKTGQFTVDKQNHWDAAQQGSMDDYINKVAVPQVKELFSNYGKVAVIWWDTPVGMAPERAGKLLPLLKMQPGIISNNRLDSKKSTGDFQTPEQFIPPQGYPDHDWEACMTMNRTWGFRSYDHDWKDTETLICNICDIASKGGNYLLNVGPTSEGLIPQPSVERLADVGKWMRVNGDAIYGTSPTPFSDLHGKFSNIEKDKDGKPKFLPTWDWRCTTKPGKLYLLIFEWPAAGKFELSGLRSKVEKAYLLADHKKLKFEQSESKVTLNLPAKAPDKIASVVCVELKDKTPKVTTQN